MTAMRTMARFEADRGAGEEREAATRRKRFWTIGALFAAGLGTGFYVGHQEAEAVFDGGRFWSPAVALALAGIYLAALIGGSLVLNGVMDEHDRHRTYKAASLAGAVYLTVYPLWFLLWKGGFVPEPIHWLLFALFWLSLALGSIWYRFR
jgi:hypothetical protein